MLGHLKRSQTRESSKDINISCTTVPSVGKESFCKKLYMKKTELIETNKLAHVEKSKWASSFQKQSPCLIFQ